MRILTYIGVACLFLAAGFLIYKSLNLKQDTATVYQQGSAPTGQTQKVKDFVAADGANHSTYEDSKTITQKDLRNPEKPMGIVDTASLLLKIARTEILSVKKISSSTSDSLLQAKKEINRLKQIVYTYKDRFVQLKYTPSVDTTSQGVFDFQYNNEVTVTQYQKRNKILGLKIGAKKSFVDISSNDPRTKINGLKSLSIEQASPSFGLRIQGSTNYNPQTNTFGFGPAARIDLGRFSFQGNYIWYPESGRWRPGITANYDFIRF